MTDYRPETQPSLADQRFDAALGAELSGLPLPDPVVSLVSPWLLASRQITAGLILTFITLRFFYLQYLLPTVGVLLLYLGFRTLRRQNRAFGFCFVLAALRLPLYLLDLVTIATPLSLHLSFATVLTWIGVALDFLLIFGYRQALHRSYREIARPPQADPLLALAIWQVAILLLSYSPFAHSWAAGAVTLIAFILIAKALTRLNRQLQSWGYAVLAAPVRLGNTTLILLYLTVSLLVTVGGALLSNNVALPAQVREEAGQSELRQELLALGFPSQVLADLSDGDVLACEGALAVSSYPETLSWELHRAGYDHSYRLDTVMVWVKLSEQRCQVIAWYAWRNPPPRFWQDALAVRCILIGESGEQNRAVVPLAANGCLLYEQRDQTYAAALTNLVWTDSQYSDLLGSVYDMDYYGATIGYPAGVKQPRGYLSQTIAFADPIPDYGLAAQFFYALQTKPLAIPYQNSRQSLFTGGRAEVRSSFYWNDPYPSPIAP